VSQLEVEQTTSSKMPNLGVALLRRAGNFILDPRYRAPRATVLGRAVLFVVGSVLTAYSIANLVYELNVDFENFLSLPFYQFWRTELIPFLMKPITWTGWNPPSFYDGVVALSGIGASIWAKAEFDTKWRFIRHLMFVERYRGPRLDLSAVGKKIAPTSRFSLSYILTVPFGLLLTYSLVGIFASLIFLIYGLYFMARDAVRLITFMIGNVFYMFEHSTYVEWWKSPKNWRSRLFLLFHDTRKALDKPVFEADPIWRVQSIDPKHRDRTMLRTVLRPGARAFANAGWLLAMAAAAQNL